MSKAGKLGARAVSGTTVTRTEQTSKHRFLDGEPVESPDWYAGKRTRKGSFRSSRG